MPRADVCAYVTPRGLRGRLNSYKYRLWTVFMAETAVASLRCVLLGVLGSCILYPALTVTLAMNDWLILLATMVTGALLGDAGFQVGAVAVSGHAPNTSDLADCCRRLCTWAYPS